MTLKLNWRMYFHRNMSFIVPLKLTRTPLLITVGTHWIGDWVIHRAGLDDMEKILDPTAT
jgi:hypothetical protein